MSDSIRLDKPFLELLKEKEVQPEDIHDYIEFWHINSDYEPCKNETDVMLVEQELSTFLGMTKYEYKCFVDDDECVKDLPYVRMYLEEWKNDDIGQQVLAFVEHNEQKIDELVYKALNRAKIYTDKFAVAKHHYKFLHGLLLEGLKRYFTNRTHITVASGEMAVGISGYDNKINIQFYIYLMKITDHPEMVMPTILPKQVHDFFLIEWTRTITPGNSGELITAAAGKGFTYFYNVNPEDYTIQAMIATHYAIDQSTAQDLYNNRNNNYQTSKYDDARIYRLKNKEK